MAAQTSQTAKQFKDVNVSANAGNLVRMLQQLQGQAAPNQLDQAALNALNAGEKDINNLYSTQMKGWHENLSGSLTAQLNKGRQALSDRGLGNLIPQAGDMGTGRTYSLTMGKLKDDWLQNHLNHVAGLSKQRAAVNSRAGSRVSNLLSQLTGAASNLYGARTDSNSLMPQEPLNPDTNRLNANYRVTPLI